ACPFARGRPPDLAQGPSETTEGVSPSARRGSSPPSPRLAPCPCSSHPSPKGESHRKGASPRRFSTLAGERDARDEQAKQMGQRRSTKIGRASCRGRVAIAGGAET